MLHRGTDSRAFPPPITRVALLFCFLPCVCVVPCLYCFRFLSLLVFLCCCFGFEGRPSRVFSSVQPFVRPYRLLRVNPVWKGGERGRNAHHGLVSQQLVPPPPPLAACIHPHTQPRHGGPPSSPWCSLLGSDRCPQHCASRWSREDDLPRFRPPLARACRCPLVAAVAALSTPPNAGAAPPWLDLPSGSSFSARGLPRVLPLPHPQFGRGGGGCARREVRDPRPRRH